MTQPATLYPLPLTDEDRRQRWLAGMVAELEAARYALVNLPDDEGPEAADPDQRDADDLLADEVHQHAASARAALRRALDLLKPRLAD